MASDKAGEAVLSAIRPRSLRPLSRLLDRLDVGHLRVQIAGRLYDLRAPQAGPSGEIQIHRPVSLAARLVSAGQLGFGEGYLAGDWDSPDPAALLLTLAANERAFAAVETGVWPQRLAALLRHRWRANTRSGSQRNIAAHYDLGNEFYQLWLDPSMTYSAAIFADEQDEDVAQAQQEKNRRLLALLDAQPGQRLLEIGCGWGAFARQAAQAGLQVTGITLSREQLDWARARLAETPELAKRCDLRLQDYRDLDGQFDRIASIEMFEAVGAAYWPLYMAQLKRCLHPDGRAALQVIVIDEAYFAGYQASPDFIQRYIFPGGMLPTAARFAQAAQAAGLEIVAQHRHGADYARTLALWQRRFLDQLAAVRALGYSERFIRMWRYYLAYCEAGFRAGRIDVMQVSLRHAP